MGYSSDTDKLPISGRKADTGAKTFDIGGMITDLEAERKRRQGGG